MNMGSKVETDVTMGHMLEPEPQREGDKGEQYAVATPVVEAVAMENQTHDDRMRLSQSYSTTEDSGAVAGADYTTGEILSLTPSAASFTPTKKIFCANSRRTLYAAASIGLLLVVAVVVLMAGALSDSETDGGELTASGQESVQADRSGGSAPVGMTGPRPSPSPSPPSPTPSSTPDHQYPSSVQAEVTFSDLPSWLEESEFEATFLGEVSNLLGLAIEELQLLRVTGFSASGRRRIQSIEPKALFEILPGNSGRSPSGLMEAFKNAVTEGINLTDLLSQITSVDVYTERVTYIGETGRVNVAQEMECARPEVPDADGHICSYYLAYGYNCRQLVQRYSYDCSCSCDAESFEVKKTMQWQEISFTKAFQSPIIVLGVPTFRDSKEIFVRVRNVTPSGFEISLQGTRCDIQQRHDMETVDWLAIEAGLWRIEQSASASAVIEAGIAVVSPGFRSSRFHEVKLSGAAAVDNIQTVVFAQVMTYNEHVPAGARVATVTPSSFEVALQEDVWDGVHAVEEIGWVAWSTGTGSIGPPGYTGTVYEASLTTFVADVSQATAPNRIAFDAAFADQPRLFAQIQSTNNCCSDTSLRCDADVAILRAHSIFEGSSSLQINEVTCDASSAAWHEQSEQVAYLALARESLVARAVGCDGAPGGHTIDACGVCRGTGDSCACWSDTSSQYSFVHIGDDVDSLEHVMEDDSVVTVELPFTFELYGTVTDSIVISSNGYFTLGTEWQSELSGMTWPIPSESKPNAIVAVWMSDLDPASTDFGAVYTLSAPSRFIVQWHMLPYWGTDCTEVSPCDTLDFEAIIYPNGDLIFQYEDISPPPGGHTHAPVSVGFENAAGTIGVQIMYGLDQLAVQKMITIPKACHVIVGCDGVAGSGEVVDACGICGGDGAGCAGCTDPAATNYDRSAVVHTSCDYECGAAAPTAIDGAPTVAPSILWGGPTQFQADTSNDRTSPDIDFEKFGEAYVDAYGLHVDGTGDHVRATVPQYADTGSFSLSFWFSKHKCTDGLYEYLWSHNQQPDSDIADLDNSNINVYIGCSGGGSSVGSAATTIMRVLMVDKPAAGASKGGIFSLDWALHEADKFEDISRQWIHYSLSVSPSSVRTYVDGQEKRSAFGFHDSYRHCFNNGAYPDPLNLNTMLNGFSLGDVAYIGGRSDLAEDRHFMGAMAGVTVWSSALTSQMASCAFHEARTVAPAEVPDSWFGCMDVLATNFVTAAKFNDDSCMYPPPCWQTSDFHWQDMPESAEAYSLSDDGIQEIELPFSFNHYGVSYDKVEISANGYVVFEKKHTETTSAQTSPVPSERFPNNAIYVMWTDLDPTSTNASTVLVKKSETQVVIEWDLPHFSDVEQLRGRLFTTFQLTLTDDSTSYIAYDTVSLSPNRWSPITVGLENADGTVGVGIAYNSVSFPTSRTAIWIPRACYNLRR